MAEKKITMAVLSSKIDNIGYDITEINKQFKELNGSVKDTIVKLAVTNTVAQSAQRRADEAHLEAIENPKENRHYIDRLFITALGSLLTALIAIIVVVIEIVIK